MGSEFLSALDLTPDEKKKLANLGAATPIALLSLCQAAPEAFDDLVGKERADVIVGDLRNLLTPEEQDRLVATPPPRRFPLGARLDKGPGSLPAPKFDIEQRDRLFEELQSLRNLSSVSLTQKQRIADLEKQLNLLLESQ